MHGRRTGSVCVVIAALAMLAETACSDSEGNTGDGRDESSGVYGDPGATSSTTTARAAAVPAPTTTASPSAAATATQAPTSVPAASTRNVANRTERLDPSGFFLVLVAGGATRFKTTDRVA